ncbi:protein kinase [Penicillium hispanicum]|uniref:protein kinase n=1 Tax=Penicillium hispanicum TaxID=1080232 RepID=UPI00254236C2|nr:protein kinase [Penicillium hispanicum]KAJ5577537.1 protein kinase [Penicillium hispanicum]
MLRFTRRLTKSLFKRPPSPARQFSQRSTSFDPNEKIEEETLQWYSPDRFYPVKIGEVFRSRYQIIGKLGFGGYSTVWLCRDLKQHVYVALKVYECDSDHGKREKKMYDHLRNVKTNHTGSILVRHALDDFQITSADSSYSYQCLVHPPLAMSLHELQNLIPEKVLPENLVKPTLIHILLALDFLHAEAHIVHTDISARNIMLGVEDQSILVEFEEAEKSNPSLQKIIEDRVIYSSRRLGIPKVHGRPILSDFGEARFTSTLGSPWEDVQPFMYRAPEVVLRMPWNHKIDIWNLGVLAWELFEQRQLFRARDSDRNRSDSHHLAGMIAILGPPPKSLVHNSEYGSRFFDNEGNWISDTEIPSPTLEKLEGNLQGEHQHLFLKFLRKMLRWRPED